jgi:hypothetical protein
MTSNPRATRPSTLLTGVSLLAAIMFLCPAAAHAQAEEEVITNLVFGMTVSEAAAECLPDAKAVGFLNSLGSVEVLHVVARGLPPGVLFNLFITQLPNAPFGLSWYNGDFTTDSGGRGQVTVIGRFSIETFIVAPGSGPAPVLHTDTPFPDAGENQAQDPVHTFHVGAWFDDPADAAEAGCPDDVTPFNDVHTAGIQALSTRDFPDDEGPLGQFAP